MSDAESFEGAAKAAPDQVAKFETTKKGFVPTLQH